MDNSRTLTIFILISAAIIVFIMMSNCKLKCGTLQENMSGFGVTSGLAFNNRMAYCQPGNDAHGGSWSGGCFLPHRVIV